MPPPVFCLVCKNCSEEDYVEVSSEDKADANLITHLSKLLNKNVKEDTDRVKALCKKCHKLVQEFGELQSRASKIKDEILEQLSGVHKIEIEDETELKDAKEEKDGEIGRKLLFVSSSDEDSTNGIGGKHTLEDLGMALVKIQGTSNMKQQPKVTVNLENSDASFQLSIDDRELLDSGALEHSSDSDYEPPTTLFVKQSNNKSATVTKTIKVEPNSDDGLSSGNQTNKPNILKKKVLNNQVSMSDMKEMDEFFGLHLVSRENDIYTCLMCNGDETVAGEAKAIILHMKQAHDTRLYICDVCGEDFRKRNLLSLHLDEHVATEEGDFQCEVCNRIFSNLRLFRIHKRMHYPQNKSWECNTCRKKYSSKNLLDEHVNTHLGLRPYLCKVCGKDFASKYTFKAHEKTHEIRPRPFRCNMCNKTFLSQQNLTQHERTHSGMKEFACHLCGKQFGSAHNLEVHSIVHTGYKPYVCGTCGKKFARKAEIRDHERTHTGERPYQCEFCGATFSQRSNLQSHKRATHYDDKRYQCTECGKGFKRRRLLDYHIKAAHTGERPFKCDICDATFVYPEHFKKHRRIHTGEKPFLCEVCGKAFNSRDNRNAHRFVHSDKKPYECLVCGTGFMRKPLLYHHMQQRGHLNDTIVVNQPRLMTDDNRVVTVTSSGEMELLDSSNADDSKLYIQDADIEHIIIDEQNISFASDEENEPEVIDEIEQVVTGSGSLDDDYEEIITSDALATGETQLIETPNGPIQLVKVRMPNENGMEEEAWIKIVSM